MTNQNSDDSLLEGITSEGAFEAALAELIVAAQRNGVDTRGGWECRDDETAPPVEVMIYELTADAE